MRMTECGRVGVLAGGPSAEHEISLKSGDAVLRALVSIGCDAKLIRLSENYRRELDSLDADTVFITLHGGIGEDGTVQGILEKMDIPYTGSGPEASRLALDKLASRRIFESQGLTVPEYFTAHKEITAREMKGFGLPVVIKPVAEGSSFGLSVVRSESEIDMAFMKAFKYGRPVLVEKFIEGRELTVGILGGKPLPVVEIVPREDVYDYNAKYTDRDTKYIVPAEIPAAQAASAGAAALKAHSVLGCRDFSRVDIRLDKSGNVFVLEVNTIPGMTERSLLPKAAQVTGMSFEGLCGEILRMAIRRDIRQRAMEQ
ncbi:MAG: D-alanine--D-alanine ligase [Candidatus Omnitrophota bacterium]